MHLNQNSLGGAWRLAAATAIPVAAVGVVVGAVVWVFWPWLSMPNWRSTLAAADSSQARTLLAAAAGRGREGIPYLAEALASGRPDVARMAAEMLHQHTRSWRKMAPEQAAQCRAELASALAERVERFAPEQLALAAELATELLARPIDDRVASAVDVAAACERIIRFAQQAAAERGDHSTNQALSERQPNTPLSAAGSNPSAQWVEPLERSDFGALSGRFARNPADRIASAGNLSTDLDELAGVVVDRADGAYLDRSGPDQASVAFEQRTRAMQWSEAPSQPKYASPVATPNRPGTLVDRQDPAEPNRRIGLGRVGPSTPWLPATPPANSASDDAGAADPAMLDTRALMHLLTATSGDRSQRAAEELRRRGFSEAELRLARQLVDPDPAVRLGLCSQLLGTEQIDPVPWLLELARDEEARVRLAALGLLATTGDPALIQHVRRLAAGDSDPRVRQLGTAVNEGPLPRAAQGGLLPAVR